jgi:Galactose oxidase, central domain/Kelch motif
VTASTDPFDRTVAAWLESLEADEPSGLTARVVDLAGTAPQRTAWLARVDLSIGPVRRPAVSGSTLRVVALAAALAAAVAIGLLAGGARPTTPDVAPRPSPVQPALTVAPVVTIAPGSWTPVEAVRMPGSGLTATTLLDGRVLIAGPVAIVFDPVTGGWSTVNPPRIPRIEAAAARLDDGRVLLVGGSVDAGVAIAHGPEEGAPLGSLDPLAAAELFDPATGTWSDVAPMHAGRGFGHTATTLADGRILVVAGSEFAALPAAELFDPATGTWTSTGQLHEARSGQTATLLDDGRVLVTGGSIVHTSASAGAELFDPVTDTWTAATPMSIERTDHEATLLDDGTVLVTGGHLAISDPGPAAQAERYDPVTDRWSPAGSMLLARYGQTATLLDDGTVLVAGGWTPDGITNEAERYDPAARAWTATAPMAQPRVGQLSVRLADGTVLAISGGRTNVNPATTSVERFSPGEP